jgi:hypothetical protein
MGSCRLRGRFGWLTLAAPELFRVPLFYLPTVTFPRAVAFG